MLNRTLVFGILWLALLLLANGASLAVAQEGGLAPLPTRGLDPLLKAGVLALVAISGMLGGVLFYYKPPHALRGDEEPNAPVAVSEQRKKLGGAFVGGAA